MGGCVSCSLLYPLFSLPLHLFTTNHALCVFVQVCHDKFTKNSDLKRHEKGAHPDKPHAFVCEVSLFRKVKVNYCTQPRHVITSCTDP